MNRLQLILLSIILIVITAYLVAGGEELLNIRWYQGMYRDTPGWTASVFFLILMVGTAMSLPLHGTLSIVAGIIFGGLAGFPISLLACTFGGTLAFLSSRYILHDLVQSRFGDQLIAINKGIREEGAFYVFCLRMIPVIPFWLINLLLGVTPVTIPKFFFATLLGLVPINLIFVYFGSQVGNIEEISVGAILTPQLVVSLGLLAMLPFLARRLVNLLPVAQIRSNQPGQPGVASTGGLL